MLPKQSHAVLIGVNACFLFAGFLSGAFVNVFLWKQNNSLLPLALFNVTQFLLIPLVFWWASRIERLTSIPSIRLGLLFNALFYGVVLAFNDQTNPYLMGMLLGLGTGCYWYGFNILSFRMVKGAERPKFNSLMGVIAAISGVLSPILSGFLISRLPVIGYTVVFAISLCVLGISFCISFWIPGEQAQQSLAAPLFARKHPNWSRALLTNVFEGMREGVFVFFAAILVFMATGSEWALGKFTAWTALLSTLSFYAVGKWMRVHWYNESMMISSILSTAVISVFMWGTTPFTILLYGVVTAIFTPLFAVPFGTRIFQIIDEAHEKHEKEYMVEREMSLNLGRVISIIGFIVTYRFFPKEWIPLYVLVAGGFQILAVWIFRRVGFTLKIPT